MKISIIIPVYNSEKTLERCITSVLSQTYQDFEIILINDGSSDGSGMICKSFIENNKNIYYIEQENKGVSSARNRGIKKASGDFLIFVDSDDTIDSQMLSELYKCQNKYDSDIVLCNYRELYEDGNYKELDQFHSKELRQIDSTEVISRVISIAEDAIFGSSCRTLFRRSLIDENNICFQEGLSIQEDMQFLLKCLAKSKVVSINPKYLYNVYINEASATGRYMSSRDYGTTMMNNWLNEFVDEMKEKIDLSENYNICVANSVLLNIANVCKKGTTYSMSHRIRYAYNIYSNPVICDALKIAIKNKKKIVRKRYMQIVFLRYRQAYINVFMHSIKNRTLFAVE